MKNQIKKHSFLFCFFVFIFSCSQKSDVQDATGTVKVQVGIQTSEKEYSLQQVDLFGIQNLKEVSGDYARFFYSPGSENGHLTGGSPRARFVKTQSVFVPSDLISMEMVTIYFHMQNLALFDKAIGAGSINQWPRSIGLETQIADRSQINKNNAFYNGQTDSMMFLPFNTNDLPIAMNAGIIAHEHFHSLFYKMVIKPAVAQNRITINSASIHTEDDILFSFANPKIQVPKVISDKERALIFNEIYLRGLNEGIADFWGWLYTNDTEFMRWSLPRFQLERSLSLNQNNIGFYETSQNINDKIDQMVELSDNVRAALLNYSYQIGTPHARFLKQMTTMQVENGTISPADAKTKMGQLVYKYLTHLSTKMSQLHENETADPESLFTFMAEALQKNELELNFSLSDCEFMVKYLNKNIINPQSFNKCVQTNNDKIVIKKP